jgi:hypothetical protein
MVNQALIPCRSMPSVNNLRINHYVRSLEDYEVRAHEGASVCAISGLAATSLLSCF